MPWPVHPVGFFGSGDQDTYKVERSLRFNSADSAYLSRTPASAGNRKTFTWSGWAKFSSDTDANIFGSGDGSGADYGVFLKGTNGLQFNVNTSSTNRIIAFTASKIRDFSAWYHLVLSVDTTQATNSNGVRIYINGVQQTLTFNVYTQNNDTPFNNTVQHRIGHLLNAVAYTNGYLTEINFIDGQALTPSSFGETDSITGRWKVKRYAGTYGTNGFYLNFADNSGTTATTLGKDLSGNGNNWTPNNFSVTAGAGNDSLLDSPTNYGTDTGVGGEVRGNYCTLNPLVSGSGTISNGNLDLTTNLATSSSYGSIQLPNAGKWYWEFTPTSNGAQSFCGISNIGTGKYVAYYGFDGQKYIDGARSNYGASYTNNDVIGVAVNCDSGSITFYKNGSSQGSISYTIAGNGLFPYFADGTDSLSANFSINFGQRPFAYTAPSGFKALCTTNLPTPTIKKPGRYMDVKTYTGTGASNSITGLDFSADLVWIKNRGAATSHAIYDTTRGSQNQLSSDTTGTEITSSTGLTAFSANGFTIGTSSLVNTSGTQYVAWTWDEAPIAGMDIVGYTGNGTNRTIAHNLGVAPKMMIVKNRLYAGGWRVYHQSIGNTKNLRLNLTNAEAVDSTIWNNTSPTSSDFAIGTDADVNRNNDTHIAYLFSEVEGFSKFGSYTGNGSSDGPFVWCGFRPRWVMIKRTDVANSWVIMDSSRNTYNYSDSILWSDLSNAETSGGTTTSIDIVSNGFKTRGSGSSINTSGGTYIFAAFAESPFKYARAR